MIPIVAVTHIPLVTGMLQIFPNAWKSPASLVVTNVREVLSVFAPYNVKAVLQGHTHVNDARGASFSQLDGRVSKEFKVNRYGIELIAEVFIVRRGERGFEHQVGLRRLRMHQRLQRIGQARQAPRVVRQ